MPVRRAQAASSTIFWVPGVKTVQRENELAEKAIKIFFKIFDPGGQGSNRGNTHCTDCGEGKYASTSGSPECSYCVNHHWAPTGSVFCTPCSRGYWDNKCVSGKPCYRGNYESKARNSDWCLPCPEGTFSQPGLACTKAEYDRVDEILSTNSTPQQCTVNVTEIRNNLTASGTCGE